MNFQYNCILHGGDRKPLVKAVSQITGEPAAYSRAPSFSYIIGAYTVSRNGVLSCDTSVSPETMEELVKTLQTQGFMLEKVVTDESAVIETGADDDHVTTEASTSGDRTAKENNSSDTLTIELPDTGFTPEKRENLKRIVASKATLLKQALETDDLSIEEHDGKLSFPWFTLHGLENEADAYSHLVSAICRMATTQKRVTAIEKPIENPKFTMRLFLIRLGFIGDEYKTARKILLRNLTGNSSWKSGHKPEQPMEEETDAIDLPENKNEGGETENEA